MAICVPAAPGTPSPAACATAIVSSPSTPADTATATGPTHGYTFAQRVDDLEAFSDAIGMRNAVAVAHSTGGVVATLLSERRPDIFSRLALLEPMVVVTESFQRMVSKRAETPRRTWDSHDDMYKYLKWHRMTGKWPDEVIRDVVNHESYQLLDGRLDMKWATASMKWSEREGDYLDLKPALRRWASPSCS